MVMEYYPGATRCRFTVKGNLTVLMYYGKFYWREVLNLVGVGEFPFIVICSREEALENQMLLGKLNETSWTEISEHSNFLMHFRPPSNTS